MIERSRPAEAEGGPVGRGTWAGDKPLCRHCSTVAIYAQGRRVGEVRDGVFRKVVHGSAHMLRRPPAWAFDSQSLLDAERSGARLVEIHDSETGNTYRASVETIHAHGFVFDRWAVAHPAEPVAEQVPLFGEVARDG